MPLIKTHLKSLGYPERITNAQIKVESVTFVDGSVWNGGDILYPDPSDPKKKINPTLPRIKPTSNVSKPPADQLALGAKSSLLRFQNASLTIMRAPTTLNRTKVSLWRFFALQIFTLPCTDVFVETKKG